MNDDELLKRIREAAHAEEQTYDAWRSSGEANDVASPRVELVDGLVAHALAQVAAARPPRLIAPARRPTRALAGRAAAALGGVLALAASIALITRRPQSPELPAYEASIVTGSEQSTRGPAGARDALVVRPGASFELILRPATRTAAAVGVRAEIASSAGATPIDVTARANEAGVVDVHGTWPAGVPGGDRELLLVVGPPDALPNDLAHAEASAHATFRVVRVHLASPGP